MTAEYKPRIGLDNRTKLETVIPLDTPYLIFLDPSNICNAHCAWCPTGSRQAQKFSKPRVMEFRLYKKIIDSITKMPSKVKTLRLYADGEPLLNVNLPHMIEYAKKTGFFGEIDTTTNGTLFNDELSFNIVKAGLDKIIVSVPHDYTDAYLDGFKVFSFYAEKKCTIYAKIIGDFLSEAQIQQFLDDFRPYCDYIYVENLAPCWPDFKVKGVKNKGIYDQELTDTPDVCPYVFYSTKINSDGTVSLCFLDWRHSVNVGDLNRQSFSDVWNGNMYRFFRSIMLQRKRSWLSFCSKCQQLTYGMPDNIDPYAEELLKKL